MSMTEKALETRIKSRIAQAIRQIREGRATQSTIDLNAYEVMSLIKANCWPREVKEFPNSAIKHSIDFPCPHCGKTMSIEEALQEEHTYAVEQLILAGFKPCKEWEK